jgi:prevent-host-death family protein
MTVVDIAEAKALLSELAERASRGEEIIIARYGRPIARLMPLEVAGSAPHRGFGIGHSMFKVADDFESPLPDDLIDAFEGDASSRRSSHRYG